MKSYFGCVKKKKELITVYKFLFLLLFLHSIDYRQSASDMIKSNNHKFPQYLQALLDQQNKTLRNLTMMPSGEHRQHTHQTECP